MVGRWFRRRDQRTKSTININSNKFSLRFFSYDTLRIASDNFSTLLGRGGYGSVFKGALPGDGRAVAIKRLLHKVDRGGFLEKMESMSHLRHKNLIQIIGFCVENDELITVYELAEMGTVENCFQSNTRSALNWEMRAAICIGIARGLSYLHEEINPRVIHRDIKLSNILLDANFIPKIGDFDLVDFVDHFGKSVGGERGTAKQRTELGGPNTEDSLTHTTVRGTMGYLAPEYFICGKYTEKVDVYSFGLVMLEIIAGRKSVDLALKDTDDRMILNWVTRMRKDGVVTEIVDPMLIDFPREDVERFIDVAILCTQANPEQRPSMFEALIMLSGRHKSDQEISEMAMRTVAEPDQWSSGDSIYTPLSTYSLTISTSGKAEIRDGRTLTPGSPHHSIVPYRRDISESKGKRVSKAAAEPVDAKPACSTTEEQSFATMDVSTYFHKSIGKIMKSQVAATGTSNRTARMTQTMEIKMFSEQVYMEAVYPPFLSGEYRLSRSKV